MSNLTLSAIITSIYISSTCPKKHHSDNTKIKVLNTLKINKQNYNYLHNKWLSIWKNSIYPNVSILEKTSVLYSKLFGKII